MKKYFIASMKKVGDQPVYPPSLIDALDVFCDFAFKFFSQLLSFCDSCYWYHWQAIICDCDILNTYFEVNSDYASIALDKCKSNKEHQTILLSVLTCFTSSNIS